MSRTCLGLLCSISIFAASPSVGQLDHSPKPDQTEALRQGIEKLRASLPRWRDILSSVDAESLQVQYKQGKQFDLLKSTALKQLGEVEKTANTLNSKVTAHDAMQLLLSMQDSNSSFLELSSALALEAAVEKQRSHAFEWSMSLDAASSEIAVQEKEIEVPVMTVVMARDAIVDLCNDRLTSH